MFGLMLTILESTGSFFSVVILANLIFHHFTPLEDGNLPILSDDSELIAYNS